MYLLLNSIRLVKGARGASDQAWAAGSKRSGHDLLGGIAAGVIADSAGAVPRQIPVGHGDVWCGEYSGEVQPGHARGVWFLAGRFLVTMMCDEVS